MVDHNVAHPVRILEVHLKSAIRILLRIFRLELNALVRADFSRPRPKQQQIVAQELTCIVDRHVYTSAAVLACQSATPTAAIRLTEPFHILPTLAFPFGHYGER